VRSAASCARAPSSASSSPHSSLRAATLSCRLSSSSCRSCNVVFEPSIFSCSLARKAGSIALSARRGRRKQALIQQNTMSKVREDRKRGGRGRGKATRSIESQLESSNPLVRREPADARRSLARTAAAAPSSPRLAALLLRRVQVALAERALRTRSSGRSESAILLMREISTRRAGTSTTHPTRDGEPVAEALCVEGVRAGEEGEALGLPGGGFGGRAEGRGLVLCGRAKEGAASASSCSRRRGGGCPGDEEAEREEEGRG